MHKKYQDLFQELARATAVSAEQVMDYDKARGDEEGFNTAQTMRDDYEALLETLKNGDTLGKAEYAKLLIGAMIVINQLQDKAELIKKALAGYRTEIIPKLNKIIEAETDEEARAIADKELNIEEN